jgi:hypothetical protein
MPFAPATTIELYYGLSVEEFETEKGTAYDALLYMP